MVATKISILVAAVALGAATAYAAPIGYNKDIALSRRDAARSTLIAREFDHNELYSRELKTTGSTQIPPSGGSQAGNVSGQDAPLSGGLQAGNSGGQGGIQDGSPVTSDTKTSTTTTTEGSGNLGGQGGDQDGAPQNPVKTDATGDTNGSGHGPSENHCHHGHHGNHHHGQDGKHHHHHHHGNHHHHHCHEKQPTEGIATDPAKDAGAVGLSNSVTTDTNAVKSSTDSNTNAASNLRGRGDDMHPGSSTDNARTNFNLVRVQRRSRGDNLYWKRGLARSLGLDEGYFAKRFDQEDAFQY